MSLAPMFDELQEPKKERSVNVTRQPAGVAMTKEINIQPVTELSHKDYSEDCISAHIFGVGGAGKVSAIRLAKLNTTARKITTIDTSGVTADIPGIESIKIPGLNGSGKYRAENIEPISNFITDLTANREFERVNIIISSFSGGSGSVICPLLVDEILRQGKIAIVLGIIDTDSEIDTTNALNCLRTMDNMANNRKGYLPMVLFDNNKGRALVDRGIDATLVNLIKILEEPYVGLDTQDRVKFLNPNIFKGVSSGVKMLCISRLDTGNWEDDLGLIVGDNNHEKIDATLLISHSEEHLALGMRCIVTFRGYYEGEGSNIIASIGYQIPESLIKDLNANIHASKSTVEKKKTKIMSEYDIGETNGNGMVL